MRSIPLSYGRGMTRYAIDTEGVSRERLALAHDPAELHECASLVAAATAGALSATGVEGEGSESHSTRFRAVHAYALDAVADAASALATGSTGRRWRRARWSSSSRPDSRRCAASGSASLGISVRRSPMSRVHEAGRVCRNDRRRRSRCPCPRETSKVCAPQRGRWTECRAGPLDAHGAGDVGLGSRRGLDRGRGDRGRAPRRTSSARRCTPRRRRAARGLRSLLTYAAALDHADRAGALVAAPVGRARRRAPADRPSPREPPGPDGRDRGAGDGAFPRGPGGGRVSAEPRVRGRPRRAEGDGAPVRRWIFRRYRCDVPAGQDGARRTGAVRRHRRPVVRRRCRGSAGVA